ncbi:Tricalbin-1, partial [Bienertia sinuspersici]
GEWNLPHLVGGINVKRALNSQCAALYIGWRYRLKEENFIGCTKKQAKVRRLGVDQAKWDWLIDDFWSDPKQQEKNEKYRRNRMKQTIKHSNGAKSTARILEELMNAPSTHSFNDDGDNNANGNGDANAHAQHDEDPIYVKLYDKTLRHKDGTMGPEAEASLNKLRDLHAKQIEEQGMDNLTPFEAFPKVLRLGYGPKPPRRQRLDADCSEVRDEIQQLQQRETEISNLLKSENALLKEQMEVMKLEILEREKKMKEESVERENKLRHELMAEFMAMMKPT